MKKDFIPADGKAFPSITLMTKAIIAYRGFLYLAAISSLTIFLRIVKYLGSYVSRVRLLQSTMLLAR